MGSIETDRRIEPRRIVDEYYSVEFSISGIEIDSKRQVIRVL